MCKAYENNFVGKNSLIDPSKFITIVFCVCGVCESLLSVCEILFFLALHKLVLVRYAHSNCVMMTSSTSHQATASK